MSELPRHDTGIVEPLPTMMGGTEDAGRNDDSIPLEGDMCTEAAYSKIHPPLLWLVKLFMAWRKAA